MNTTAEVRVGSRVRIVVERMFVLPQGTLCTVTQIHRMLGEDSSPEYTVHADNTAIAQVSADEIELV